MQYSIIQLKTIYHEDSSYGALSVFEGVNDIPFEIKRIYYICGADDGIKRGMHAHKELKQMMFCPYGEIEIELDDGWSREIVLLDKPSKGLVLMPGLWRNMIWRKKDSVLCVVASEYYSSSDYIRDYDAFLAFVQDGNNNGGL